jgi:hypothetical protein
MTDRPYDQEEPPEDDQGEPWARTGTLTDRMRARLAAYVEFCDAERDRHGTE